MERDLQVHTEDVVRPRAELAFVVEFFGALGHVRCDAFFGWAWSVDRDNSDLLMKGVNIPLIELDGEIRRAEDAGLGSFAGDDVRVSFEGRALTIQFCHHSGVHLSNTEPDEITERFFTRWHAGNLDPVESEKTEDPRKWRRIRGGDA